MPTYRTRPAVSRNRYTPGQRGSRVSQVDLLEAGPGLGRWELDQVLEGQDPVGAGPLEQAVEHVDGRLGVGQRPVAGATVAPR